jgi:hypothetical protein
MAVKKPALILFLLLILIGSLYNCNKSPKKDIKEFYYPVTELKQPKVYEYRCTNIDSLAPYFLYFNTIVQKGKVNFTSTFYNARFEVQSISIEEMLNNGMVLNSLKLYQTNPTTGKSTAITAKINTGAVYPFQVTDSLGVFVYNISINDTADTTHTTHIIRNRSYTKDTTYNYQNKTYPAVIFKVRQVQDDDHKGHLEIENSTTEIYAKGIGLVYIKRNVSNTMTLTYELKDIYTMEDLEKKYAKTTDK